MPQRNRSGARSHRRWLLPIAALIVQLWGPSPGLAAEDGGDDVPLLRSIPDVAEGLKSLPPFLRDTDLTLHLRTYYFNQRNSSDTISEAWAGGGWLTYRSGWLLGTFQMGATVFTSIPLYAPDDRGGTDLLLPGQVGFIVPGVAYGALRYEEYALLTGYRQLVNQTYVNAQDNRMAPNTFEGVTLKGQVGFVDYLVGYLTQMKQRDASTFISMAEAAGVKGNSGGLALGGVVLKPGGGFTLQLSNQYGNDVFNTAFAQADYTHAFTAELALTFSGQYTDQRAVGGDLLGGSKFTSWVTSVGGTRVQLRYQDLTLTGAFSMTGKGNDIQTPFGHYPGYLRLIVKDFDSAGEVAWLAGLYYELPRALLPGASAELKFAQGWNAVSPTTRKPVPDQREYDIVLYYGPPKTSALRGFGFEVSTGLVDTQGNNKLGYQIRLILNYELPLL
jgi:hypothetical protein